VRACLLDLEVGHDPLEESGVGVADLLDLLERRLELADPSDVPRVLLAEERRCLVRFDRRLLVHVPSRRVTKVSLK